MRASVCCFVASGMGERVQRHYISEFHQNKWHDLAGVNPNHGVFLPIRILLRRRVGKKVQRIPSIIGQQPKAAESLRYNSECSSARTTPFSDPTFFASPFFTVDGKSAGWLNAILRV